ncbi:MAG: fasciclin domain-containing protein [Thermoanaerobaculia bacterium]|nr:fasciclin domain-containing protein [Thermoanaerobaculia bacterium]
MPADIIDTAVAAGSFETLAAAIEAAGLIDTLKGEGPFTVFAPTDEAFAKLPEGTVEGLLADKAALTEVLTYHVVAGKVMAADVAGLDSAATLQGSSLPIDTSHGVKVGTATVTKADIVTSNGVIHVIDTVLIPN